ncbi:MAG: RagB/SusD family nutrient uptake outer membrane protein [Bacteroidia bacterium]|nr:RagB/SusD family nutrient uptake outer membrane protein [Bacteroidia bacterium]
MRKLLYILSTIILIVIVTSCEKGFLDTKPLGAYSDADVWKDPALVATFVNGIYREALGWPFAIERLSDYVDESSFTPDWGAFDFNKSIMTSDSYMGWDWDWGYPDPTAHTRHYRWDPLYKNVRACNLFFSQINKVEFSKDATGEALKQNTIGEIYFLRAYTYHYLVALYGGVPIITKPYGLDQDYNIARNTYEQCISYIVSQLDSAAMNLPDSWAGNERGHATKGAALALKARTLLYAASDLHNSASISSYASGYANPELLGYTSGTQADRWTAAKNAAKAVMDMGIYSLYKATPAAGDSVAQNFVDYFLAYGYETEDILLQYFTTKTGQSWSDYNPALYSGPNGYHNWGNNTPIGDLVDDYEMKDGSSFDWALHAASPYSNREARFYASILYEGCPWRKRPSDVQAIDPWDKIQVGHVFQADGTTQQVPGVDTRESSIENWNGGRSGYYLRKFNDPSLDPQFVKQDIPFRHIRYAEVLLNYAEACIELGDAANLTEATTYINMIRTRAGQPGIAAGLSQAALRTAVRHERRIELAFEDHRFWDVRRWVIGPAAYHPTHRADVKYITSSTVTNYRQADGSTWGAPIYSNQLIGVESRAWNDKCYFFPFYRSEMNKNTSLVQNPGY